MPLFTTSQMDWIETVLGLEYADEGFERADLRRGMEVELEHGSADPSTDVTGDDPLVTAKIALAHLREFPDYYDRLEVMERQAHGAEVDLVGYPI